MNKKNFYIITRTPLRVSFFGGGTDIPKFYNKNYGEVLSTSINRYIYTSIKSHDDLFEEDYRLNYSITEHVNGIKNIKNSLIRSCLHHLDIKQKMHITISTDIPAFSGLGASSSIIVGLLWFIICFFYRQVKNIFNNSLFIWIGNFKESKKILGQQSKEIPNKIKYYKNLLNLVTFAKSLIKKKKFNLKSFGELLDKNWSLKKKLSKNITNLEIDKLYTKCLKMGAIGGKVLGAGSGGFLFIVIKKEKKKKLIQQLKSSKIYSFMNSSKGVETLYKNFY